MRKLYIELVEESPNEGEIACRSTRKEVSDGAIKQCLYGKPFDLLAEVQDLADELNQQNVKPDLPCAKR